MVFDTRIVGVVNDRHVVGLAAGEAAEEGGDDGLGNDDFVVTRAAFEVQKLHADRLGGEDLEKVVCVHAVLGDEAFEDVEAFGSQHVDATLLEKVGCGVGAVLNEAGIHEMLGHSFGHVSCH